MTFFEPTASGSLANLFNSIVSATADPNGSAEDPRTAMVFSSRFRQSVLRDIQDRQAKLGTLRLRENLTQADLPSTSTQFVTGFSADRNQTFALESQIRDLRGLLQGALPSIPMELNPNSVEFDQPKKFSLQDTIRGKVYHHFSNNKGQNNDILTIKFRGNTGNISLQGSTPEEIQRSKRRLLVWQNLYHLTREPMLLSNGSSNAFYITYMSALFQVDITFTGFFSHVLRFSENADKPRSRDYSMEFIVQETSPDLDDILALTTTLLTGEAIATPTDTSTILTS